MCTIIVSVRSVLWAVMTIAASLMVLLSIFSDRWLVGDFTTVPRSGAEVEAMVKDAFNKFEQFADGRPVDTTRSLGLFLRCKKASGDQMGLFIGECLPNLYTLEEEFYSADDTVFPHAWKGAVLCFATGLAIMVMTVALSLVTPCLRYCCCCSIFTLLGVIQSFSAVLFTLGLLAYPAGWGSDQVRQICGPSDSFVLGHCKLGGAFWMAVAGTVCTFLASSLTVFAYKSTKSHKTLYRRQDGDMVICVP